MKYNNDTLIEALTDVFKSQEGFKKHSNAEIKDNIRGLFDMHNKMMQLGREAFFRHGEEPSTAHIFQRIDHRVNHAPGQFKTNKDHIVFVEERDYFTLYRILLSVFEQENYPDSINMAMVLAILEPLRMQPYIILGTILMREAGAQGAAEFYQKIMANFKDPLLYFYAADAYAQADMKSEAKGILKEAIELTKHLKSSEAKELRNGLESYLQSL
jgi:tetratricopeptide (TPR) repeat protein